MFELKVPSPVFVQSALQAGRADGFEAAMLLFARGLTEAFQTELVEHWRDLDDLTHNDIMVITIGIGREHSGICAYGMQRHIIAEEVAVAHPFGERFSEHFEQLLQVADHVPSLSVASGPNKAVFDSHGTTDIRRVLNIREKQLPALLIILYRDGNEYLVELGHGESEISPISLISAVAKELDDVPYKQQKLRRRTSELMRETTSIWFQMDELRRRLSKHNSIGELQSVVLHLNKTLAHAPNDLKEVGSRIIEFLKGVEESPEVILSYKGKIKEFAESQRDQPWARRLPKKLSRAIGRRFRNEPFEPGADIHDEQDYYETRERLESQISALREKHSALRCEESNLYSELDSLDIKNAVRRSVETGLEIFGLREVRKVECLGTLSFSKSSKSRRHVYISHEKSTSGRQRSTGILRRFYNSLTLQPNISGVGIDVKRMIHKAGEKKEPEDT